MRYTNGKIYVLASTSIIFFFASNSYPNLNNDSIILIILKRARYSFVYRRRVF